MYDSSDDDGGPEITKLQGEENFHEWETRALCVLILHGLDGFIRGTETPPLGNTPEAMEELKRFKDRKWRAWYLLHQSVRVAVAQKHILIRGCDPYDMDRCDAKALWDAVQRWYNDNISPALKLDLLRELTSIDYRQFDDFDAFLIRALRLRLRLERAGMPIADEMMKTCLYGGLFPHHPSEILRTLIITRYDDWDLDKMITDMIRHSYEIQDQANRHQQEQQEINKRRNANRQFSGHRGGSSQRGRRH